MKKVFFQPLTVILLVVFASLASCSSKYPGFDKTEAGLYYKMFKISKDTIKPKVGDWVTLDYKLTVTVKSKDSVLLDSRKTPQGAVRLQIPPSDYKGDLYSGMEMMSAGDSAIFIIPADSLFKHTFKQPSRPAFVDSNSVVQFFVHMKLIENPADLKKKEGEALTKYLETNKITVAPTPSGCYFIESEKGKGMKIDSGTMVKLHFVVSLLDGKQIFSTRERAEPIEFEYGQRFDTPGFEEAIGMMTKGGKAKVIVPSSMGFGEQGRGTLVPAFSTLVYDVELIDVQSKADYEKVKAEEKKKAEAKKEAAKNAESGFLQKYLKDKKITVKPTASGLYYIEKVKGTGPQAMQGKKLSVNYVGTLLDGTKFDSNRDRGVDPMEFELGKGQVIKGWEEGFALMKKGGKATFIIPSSIAYGERSMGPVIKPYSPLVFEVELVDVK
jgi:FKBP-type peptidyl-prolyl cis-trans isomerase